MADTLVRTGKLVTVFGGSGFVGRSVAKALAANGWRVRVASRRPSLAFALQPSGIVGQITAVQANLRYPESVARAVRDADAVVNLVALLAEGGKQSFEAVHVEGTRAVVEAVKAAGIPTYVQVSAIGADSASSSHYGRTKAQAEAIVHDVLPQAVVIRPSLIFGAEDKFFNRFAAMAQLMPALPLIGGGNGLMQPVFVGDVAQAIARAVDGKATSGATYELGGPDAHSFKQILRFILKTTGRQRALIPVPFPAAGLLGIVAGFADRATFGFLPDMLVITRDQVELLKVDNVVSEAAAREGRTLQGLGIVPESYQAFVPTYLYRFRKTGQYGLHQAG